MLGSGSGLRDRQRNSGKQVNEAVNKIVNKYVEPLGKCSCLLLKVTESIYFCIILQNALLERCLSFIKSNLC